MIRTIFSLGSIVFVVALVATGTVSFFSDTESSTNNTFTAGAVDLQIDNESYYNGELNDGTSWELADLSDGQGPGPNGAYLFFNFLDVKPDDEGEDTISIHVEDNDAWACMDVTVTDFDDNDCTEPEGEDGDVTCGEDEGELQNEINFIWWPDDGDNVLEVDEVEQTFYGPQSLGELEIHVPLADASGDGLFGPDPLVGGDTYYLGKAWCFGTLTTAALTQDGLGNEGDNGPLDRGTGIECDGSGLDNTTQTDSVMGTVSFEAIQSRHNDEFICDEGGSLGCSEKADVMLVLDVSGSLDADELADMKVAAAAFVDALVPAADGVHIGVVQFHTGATLLQGLTDVEADIDTAIAGAGGGGSTNLEDGIRTAQTELDDNGRGDAPDFMVIITDGEPTASDGPGTDEEDAEDAADDSKGLGTEIFAVGVGIDTGAAMFLHDDIVSPIEDDHYFDSADFDELELILEELTMCPDELLKKQEPPSS